MLLLIFCCLILFSCRSFYDLERRRTQEHPIATAEKFVFPATWTQIPSSTTPSLTPLPPSQTPTQLPSKSELISYTILGGDGSSPEIGCLLGHDYLFKLYGDGQLIYLDSSIVRESYLSETEVQELLSQIAGTGFFDVNGTGELREEDPIYENAPAFVETGSAGHFLRVKDKEIETDNALKEYLTESISQTFEIISSFTPEESHIYSPDLILLWIFPIENSDSMDWYPATPIPPIQEWPGTISSLQALMLSEGDYYAFIGGLDSKTIFEIHGFFPSGKVYTDNGQEYYVVACPVEP